MAQNDWKIGLIGGLDGTRSRSQLNSDINGLAKNLDKLKLYTEIDKNQAKQLQQQIRSLQLHLNNVLVTDAAINGIVNQINAGLKNITIGNISIGNMGTSAQQTGRQIGQQITQGIQSAIQKGNFKQEFLFSFDKKNNVAKQAQAYFRTISDGIVSVQERMTDLKEKSSLQGFIVNIKNAQGQVESLHYSLRNIVDKSGNITGQMFKYTGGTINDKEAIKQIQAIENAFADYTQKLAQFKSTNTNILSGLSIPLKDFETKLSGLKNGTATIDEVKNSYKLLGTEASKVTANFTGTLSKTDAAIRKLSQSDEIMDGLKASFKGLSNAPKDINTELNKVSKLLREVRSIESKEGRTVNWSAKYRAWSDEVDKLKAKLSVLQKQQASMTTTTVYSKKDIENLLYTQKILNTISATEGELRTKLTKAGYTDIKIKGIEDATGKIKELEVTANNAAGALEKINFSRIKVQGGGKSKRTQDWLVQSGDVQVLKSATTAHEELAKSAQTASNNLADLKTKWEYQGVLVGDFKTKVEQLESSLANVGSKSELDKLTSRIKTLKTEASRIADVNRIQFSIDTGGYESKIQSLVARTNQWVDSNGNARISTSDLQSALNNLNTAYANLTSTGGQTAANQQALIDAERALDVEVRKVQNSVTSMNATMMKSTAVDSLRNKIQQFYDLNSAAHRDWGGQLKAMMTELSSGAEISITRGRELEQQLYNIQNAARAAGKLGKSFFDTIKSGMKSFSYWTSSTFIVMKSIQELKQATQFAKDFNSAMTNINYTMDISSDKLDKIGQKSLETAKNLKTSAENVLQAVTTYANANETAESILSKAQPTIMLSNVSGMDTTTTTDILQGTIHQFDLEDTEETLLHVSDVLQTVSQSMAVDFSKGIKEMADGIQVSGSVARDAGYDLESYTALLGNLIEKTRQSGSELGRSLRTMFVRTSKASTSALAGGEVTEDDLSNAEKALRRVGIEVRDSTESFRDFDDIMADLYEKIDDLSEVDLANIAYEVASTRQTAVFKVMVKSWGDYIGLAEKANDANGTTFENQEKYAESLNAKMQDLSTTMETAMHNMINEDTISPVITALTKLAEAFAFATDNLGLFGTIGAGAGIFALTKNLGSPKITGTKLSDSFYEPSLGKIFA